MWVEVNLQNLFKSKSTKFCLLNCVEVCYIHDQKTFNSWLHCTCLWCQDKDNVYSDKHCVLENKIRLVLFLEWEGYFQHKGFEIKSYSTNQELIMWISQVTFQKRSETGIRNTICNKTWTEEKQSSHTSFGKISSQPHTIVKQICFPYGNVLFLSLLSLSKNWMHNVVWGCAEILPLP